MRQLKGKKKKDKFASLKPLQTWNFLPPCSVLVLDMYTASPASQLQFGSSLAAVSQLSHQYRLLDYGRNHLYNSRSPGCLLCSQRRWELPQPLPKGASSCCTQFGTLDGTADPLPEAAQAGPHHHQQPALGTRSEDKQDTIYSCPLLHTCHLFCSLSCARGGGRQDSCSWPSWWRKHDPECVPTPSHAVEVKQCLKSSCFTSLFLRPAKGLESPRRAFRVAGTRVGATVMSQFRLKRNPIGTSLLKATS